MSAPQAALQLTADEKAKTDNLCFSAFLLAVSIAICVPARAPLVLAMKNGDASATAKTLGLMSTTAAFIEFLLNPVLGRLSDKYGRKPFLLLSPAFTSFLHSFVFMFPNILQVNVMDRCISGAMIFAFMNPVGAALQDIFAPHSLQKLGAVGGKLGSAFGMGFALGPLIGSKLGGARAFGVSSLCFAGTALSIAIGFEETLPLERRKEFDPKAINPLSFIQLFATDSMAKLSTVVGLGSFAEYANIYDINFLFMKTVMGYGQNEVGLFATGFGVTQIGGGMVAASLIKSLGQETMTKVANAAYIVGFMLLGTAKGAKQLGLALFCLMFGHNRSAYAGILLSEKAAATGMGRGEFQGAQANMLAILKIIAPTLFGRMFAWATTGGRNLPGIPYFLICLSTAAAQGVFSKALVDDPSKARS